MQSIFLKPGACVATAQPTFLKTILGSCVAVALFDPVARVAGMNHFLLPEAPANLPVAQEGRYGNTAIALLLKKIIAYGGSKDHVIAKVFGGGAVVQALNGEFNVGDLNIAMAKATLKKNGIKVSGEDTGGFEGRHVTFNTLDFSITVREIERSV
jgi:chemotaxis protein CheD